MSLKIIKNGEAQLLAGPVQEDRTSNHFVVFRYVDNPNTRYSNENPNPMYDIDMGTFEPGIYMYQTYFAGNANTNSVYPYSGYDYSAFTDYTNLEVLSCCGLAGLQNFNWGEDYCPGVIFVVHKKRNITVHCGIGNAEAVKNFGSRLGCRITRLSDIPKGGVKSL